MSESDPRNALGSLETVTDNLVSMYQEVLERIVRGSSRNIALRALSWLLHAARPLHMAELQEALSIRSGDRQLHSDYLISSDIIIRGCEGLVKWDELTDIVRFSHYSIYE